MKLTKKDKLAISRLLGAGQILSNVAFNFKQHRAEMHILEAYRADFGKLAEVWDKAHADAKPALRKLQLPPF